MSSEIAIKVEHLSKCYQIYDQPRDRLKQFVLPRLQRTVGLTQKQYYREFWALEDVSFDIPKGKVLGVLGKNGAGKSTLLQIICGTLAPSGGSVTSSGRVAALLELGSGFNPEFTGIENIYLNGQILGLDRDKIDLKLNEILQFADIGDFVHQPVKTYSSGMLARLAFSVAVNVEPDLLIVDEALSVGDSWFQHKSMARMRQLMTSGCSVLFVSHSIDAVRALCDDAIWLDQGKIKMQGNVTEVTNAYMNDVFIDRNRVMLEVNSADDAAQARDFLNEQNSTNDSTGGDSDLNASAESTDLKSNFIDLLKFELRNSQGVATGTLLHNEDFFIDVCLRSDIELSNVNVGFLLTDIFGQQLAGGNLLDKGKLISSWGANSNLSVRFSSKMRLRGGQSYSLSLRVTQGSCRRRSDMVILFLYERISVVEVLLQDEPNWIMFDNDYAVETAWGN